MHIKSQRMKLDINSLFIIMYNLKNVYPYVSYTSITIHSNSHFFPYYPYITIIDSHVFIHHEPTRDLHALGSLQKINPEAL